MTHAEERREDLPVVAMDAQQLPFLLKHRQKLTKILVGAHRCPTC
jgi:hypothetical protein